LWIPLSPSRRKKWLCQSLLSIVSQPGSVFPKRNSYFFFLSFFYSGHSPKSHCQALWTHCVRL
jgi:hypothetical protein